MRAIVPERAAERQHCPQCNKQKRTIRFCARDGKSTNAARQNEHGMQAEIDVWRNHHARILFPNSVSEMGMFFEHIRAVIVGDHGMSTEHEVAGLAVIPEKLTADDEQYASENGCGKLPLQTYRTS
jgi:hypothetical protein